MKKPNLSFWQIWNMSFGFFGIQFGFGLQNANVSRIFQTLGADIESIPILWIAAPVTGLIVQPIIGHLSDNTWGRWGRRRPYFLVGAILASLALILMPNSPSLWIAAGMLWIMDASINISMEPFRAFVGDMLPSRQRTMGFAMQSFFIGLGAVIASGLPYILTNWLGIPNVAEEGKLIPPSVKYAFYAGGIVFFLAVLWTVLRTREYSPEQLKAFEDEEKERLGGRKSDYKPVIPAFFRAGSIWFLAGVLLFLPVYLLDLEKELYILSFGLGVFGIIIIFSGILNRRGKQSGLTTVITDLFNMPQTMKQLAVVQFFSWLALFSLWIYTTAGVTSHIYGTIDTKSKLYNDGAEWVGVLFSVYNGMAAVFAFLLPVLARFTNRKITHSISLFIGGISLASVYLFKNPDFLILPMVGIGLAWASILSMPYAILTGALPQDRMGTFMGIFNFFIVIPQILAASILGFMVKHLFGGDAIYALVFGGASLLIAAVFVLFVRDVDEAAGT